MTVQVIAGIASPLVPMLRLIAIVLSAAQEIPWSSAELGTVYLATNINDRKRSHLYH